MKKGKIAYRFKESYYPGNILYINLIANYSCVNDCKFCGRPRTKEEIGRPNIYEEETDSFLYLPKSPSIDEIMADIEKEIKPEDTELAFVGLGEPLIYLPKVVEVIKKVKERYNIKTRVNTGGLVRCMYPNANPTELLEQTGLDEIRISLNAVNKIEYDELCKPVFDNAFPNLVSFVQECVNSKIKTYISFVVDFKDEIVKTRSQEEYTTFALSLGVNPGNIIFRKYRPPLISQNLQI